ncbi:MAG: hypothetical protein OQK51_03965 [Kangiellaceae bacterium]|nr:hypothetical protein [Kangiellaceae bacterium]
MKRIVLVLVGILLSASASAFECQPYGCVSTISDLYTNANGYIYVATPDDETKANCTVYPGNYFVLKPESQNADKIYSSLLAAYVSQKKVQLRVVEGSPVCELAYVRMHVDF